VRAPLIILIAGSLAGCFVFRLPTVQGNVLEQKQIDQLEIGMTPEQVRFLLGSPMVQDSFDPNHWDYVYYYRSTRGKVSQRAVSLYFENDKLARIEGATAPTGEAKDGTEDLQKARKTLDTKTSGSTDTTREKEDPLKAP
jgi:outer membrane protein assembly factor BamE (lipoprotein component of BamABCDE complex)